PDDDAVHAAENVVRQFGDRAHKDVPVRLKPDSTGPAQAGLYWSGSSRTLLVRLKPDSTGPAQAGLYWSGSSRALLVRLKPDSTIEASPSSPITIERAAGPRAATNRRTRAPIRIREASRLPTDRSYAIDRGQRR